MTSAALYANAVQRHQQGNLQEAEQLYRQVLQSHPDHADALHLLGIILGQTDQNTEVTGYLRRAAALNPGNAAFQNNLGESLYRNGEFAEAAGCARTALRLQPNFAPARFLLANALKGQGEVAAAIETYRQVLSMNPQHAKAHYNLANTLREEGLLKEAIVHYKQSSALQPGHVDTCVNMGHTYREDQQIDTAIECYRKGLSLAPSRAELYGELASVLFQQGRVPEAIENYRKELDICPSASGEFRLATLSPVVPESNEEIDAYRARLEQTLDAAIRSPFEIKLDQLHSTGIEPPFPLAYQGRNDLQIKVKHAQIFLDRMQSLTATGIEHSAKRTSLNGRLKRIGFVVTRGHEGVFMKCQRGILENINGDLFHASVVCSAFTKKYLQTKIRNPAIDYVVIGSRVDEAAKTIRAAQFDVLLYWEVGTDSLNYFLPFFRLAPVQSTTFGWPVTTGIPQMDYFVSSELLEIPEADSHFSERLFRLKTLPTYYYRPDSVANPPGRDRFKLNQKSHIYFCGQRIRKFHPDFDPLVAEILRADPAGLFVIISDAQPRVTRLLTDRMRKTLPDVFDRVRVVEWLSEADYQSLNGLADVILDTPHYGGGANTLCDSFAAGKPVVTLPGLFQRSRYCAAAYSKMGLTGCVASTPRQYVEIAVRLGTGADYRRQVIEQINSASSVLFEDIEAVREYERFFAEAIAQA